MNKEVLELLKESSEDARKIKEKKVLEERKAKLSKERFIQRSKTNANNIFNIFLREAIKKYNDDPISILNFKEQKNYKSYNCERPLLSEDEIKSRKNYKFAHINNMNYSSPKIHFILDERTGKQIPLLVESYDRLYTNRLHFYNGNVYCSFNNSYIRDLSYKAVNHELDESKFDKETINMLVNSYNLLKEKVVFYDEFLKQFSKNNQILYMEIYKKALEQYKLYPNFTDIKVKIELDSNITEQNIIDYNDTMSDDRILSCSYNDKEGNLEYILVQYNALREMLEKDATIGYSKSYYRSDALYVEFNMKKLEQTLLDVDRYEKTISRSLNK